MCKDLRLLKSGFSDKGRVNCRSFWIPLAVCRLFLNIVDCFGEIGFGLGVVRRFWAASFHLLLLLLLFLL